MARPAGILTSAMRSTAHTMDQLGRPSRFEGAGGGKHGSLRVVVLVWRRESVSGSGLSPRIRSRYSWRAVQNDRRLYRRSSRDARRLWGRWEFRPVENSRNSVRANARPSLGGTRDGENRESGGARSRLRQLGEAPPPSPRGVVSLRDDHV